MFSRAHLLTAARGLVLSLAIGAGVPSFASGTPAGTSIDNVATAT